MSSYRTAETLQTYATRDAREASIANQLRCQSLVCRPTPPTVLSPAARIACVLVLLLRIMHQVSLRQRQHTAPAVCTRGLLLCLPVCCIAPQHVLNQLRLQQYTTKVNLSSKFLLLVCFIASQHTLNQLLFAIVPMVLGCGVQVFGQHPQGASRGHAAGGSGRAVHQEADGHHQRQRHDARPRQHEAQRHPQVTECCETWGRRESCRCATAHAHCTLPGVFFAFILYCFTRSGTAVQYSYIMPVLPTFARRSHFMLLNLQ